ncbi:glutathione S-transferase U8 [Citrus sinensis]|uniref:Glutathione S-transferase U8 n=1 Tax=Citrus sinensis TaxID=2711 RepID=A0ACB8LCS2_CITSI|nr:glutathione S-transferase U8 [Citrus sinensis]
MEEQAEVKLLGRWFSVFSVRVEWALKLKGIKYVKIEEDTTNKSSLLLNSNPIYKRIPVLFHNEKCFSESLVIIEYIDDTWKQNPSILPQDPAERAVAQVLRNVIFSRGERQERQVKQIKDAMEVIEKVLMLELKGKKFFGGDADVGLIDIVLGWLPIWLDAIGEAAARTQIIFDSQKYPCWDKWTKNFSELPFVIETLPPRDKLVVHFKQLRKLMRASAARVASKI